MAQALETPASQKLLEEIIDEEKVRVVLELTDDSNPIHTDADYAARTIFGRPIAPLFSSLLYIEGDYPLTEKHLDVNGKAPIAVGDSVYMHAGDPSVYCDGEKALKIEISNLNNKKRGVSGNVYNSKIILPENVRRWNELAQTNNNEVSEIFLAGHISRALINYNGERFDESYYVYRKMEYDFYETPKVGDALDVLLAPRPIRASEDIKIHVFDSYFVNRDSGKICAYARVTCVEKPLKKAA